MRHIFSKCSGTLGETGSVSNFAFRFVGLITLAGALTAELEEILIESWASDYRAISEGIEVETEWSQFAQVKKYLTSKNIEIVSSGGEYVSTNSVELTDFDKALKVYTLVESLEEDEDVESVWHNSVIPESLSTQILEHVERNRFRT